MPKTQAISINDYEEYYELQKSKAAMSGTDAVRHDADDVHTELDRILEAYGL